MTDGARAVDTVLGRVHVEVRGTGDGAVGDAVLLWPSLLMDGSLWAAQVEHLAPRFTTIAVDPPGHGRSEPLRRGFAFEQCARVVVQILDAVGADRAHVVGNSWGAMIGGTVAARHPDRVRSAVLMNGTASPAPARQKAEYTALVALARALGGIRGPLSGSVVNAFLGPTSRRLRPEVVERVVAVAARNEARSAGLAVRSVVTRRPDQTELFASIGVPVLVVAGREDATFPVAEVHRMAEAIPGAEFLVIEDAAHLVALEVPERVNAILDGFLTRH